MCIYICVCTRMYFFKLRNAMNCVNFFSPFFCGVYFDVV